MNEEWVDVEGYEGLYQVSNLGRIKSLPKIKGLGKGWQTSEQILPIRSDRYGYSIITLSKKSKLKTKKIHRLVATAFIPNPENKPQVNHKNGIKTDNRVENLEWVTRSENMKHAYTTGLKRITEEQKVFIRKGAKKRRKLTNDQVSIIARLRKITNFGYTKLSKIFSIPRTTICRALTRIES